jgi:hypothetical protein
MRTAEEILQEYWDDNEGEMTFEDILRAMEDYAGQWKEDYELGTVDDPFEYD